MTAAEFEKVVQDVRHAEYAPDIDSEHDRYGNQIESNHHLPSRDELEWSPLS